MGDALGEARRERELTKAALETSIDSLEQRVRSELDWKRRLSRDGPRYAVIGAAAVAVVAGALTLRALARRGGRRGRDGKRPAATTLEEVAEQLRDLRRELDGRGGGSRAWQKMAMRAASAAGGAAGAYATRRVMDRFSTQEPGAEGHAGRSPRPWE